MFSIGPNETIELGMRMRYHFNLSFVWQSIESFQIWFYVLWLSDNSRRIKSKNVFQYKYIIRLYEYIAREYYYHSAPTLASNSWIANEGQILNPELRISDTVIAKNKTSFRSSLLFSKRFAIVFSICDKTNLNSTVDYLT